MISIVAIVALEAARQRLLNGGNGKGVCRYFSFGIHENNLM